VRLTVRVSSPPERILGFVGIGVGAVASAAGLLTLFDPACLMGGDCGHGGASVALLAGGAALAIASGLLVRSKQDASVTQEPVTTGATSATTRRRSFARGPATGYGGSGRGAMCLK
jgi:hypothetical protein